MLTVFARYLDGGFTIAQQVYLRTSAAFVITVVVFARLIRWRLVTSIRAREWAVLTIRAVLIYVLGTTLFAEAATVSTVADVSFIAALPLVPALGLLLGRVRATRTGVGSIAGSAVGAAILSGGGFDVAGAWNRGNLIALLAVIALSIGYLGRDWHDGTLNNYEITTFTVGFGVIGVASASALGGEGIPHVSDSPAILWAAVGVAGILNALNVYLVNYGFEHVDAVRGGNLLTVECVWGLLFGVLFYRQIPTPTGILGGSLIVACAIGLNVASGPRPPPGERDPDGAG
ncbi:DMT family transporter [Nocardia arizonensis]|uniref:DMT family transporter n=1 Tax=Nocardia arizonensis TaxID=1141647 RepID=UPI0006D14EEB|nr:DMT family transporter [Nocardia arizonensis]